MKKLKEAKASYYKPTPKKWRQIGDGMLLVSGVVAIFVPGAKWAIALGLVGKYLSNFKSE